MEYSTVGLNFIPRHDLPQKKRKTDREGGKKGGSSSPHTVDSVKSSHDLTTEPNEPLNDEQTRLATNRLD